MASRGYTVWFPSALGPFGIVWRDAGAGPRIRRILLPHQQTPSDTGSSTRVSSPIGHSCAPVSELGERIQSFLAGQAISFELDLIALEECSVFQRSVLVAEHRIPRGWVSTYGRIARALGQQGAARAVGRALARNPFPIVIPCHRAIRADGELGGYQGGVGMKRALLEMEGVEVSEQGRVVSARMFY
jgi:methylated-DNA-[protein]-cysteine S-methyltransferase